MRGTAGEALELVGVSKSFPGVRALDSVDFDLHPGEVHVLLGENGAGKSTLIKMMSGVHRPSAGQIRIGGKQVRLAEPEHAERLGVATIHQETALVPELTVAENIYLGRPPRRFGMVDRRGLRSRAGELVERTGLALDIDARVGDLGVAQRQTVEIAKALSLDARYLIMDEPTAVLSRSEVTTLFALIEEMTRRGVAIVFISHLLDEVAEIGNRATVLRDGAKVAEVPADTDTDELVRLMVGRAVQQQYPARRRSPGQTRLEVRSLRRRGVLRDVTFTARAGEVVGIGGLVGAGRTELVRAIFGADRYDHGEVRVAGRPVRRGDIAASRAAGLALIPEDRGSQGLVLESSVEENLGLATLSDRTRGGLVDLAAQRSSAEKIVRQLRIRTSDLGQRAATLSGGNQQKIVIGKWLLARPGVLILDEPTRGIDVGARAEIYELIEELAADGTTVIVVSSDLPELLGISDRVLVMADGRLRGQLHAEEATQERVMALAVMDQAGVRGGDSGA